jgi:hypothetical protein
MIKNSPMKFRGKVYTPDNWYPTSSDSMVDVVCIASPIPTVSGKWEVFINFAGDDDFAMRKSQDNLSRADAVRMFRDWKKILTQMESVTIKGLEAIGFERF